MRTVSRLVCSLLILTTLAFTCQAQDVKRAWKDVLRKCTKTDVLGRSVLFFGPSNDVGPGSIWRKTKGGGYNLRYELSDGFDDSAAKLFLKPGSTATCTGDNTSSWSLALGIPFVSQLASLTGDVGLDLKRARDVKVHVTGWSMDQIKEGPFEDALAGLKLDNGYRRDLEAGNRIIIVKGIRLIGFTTELTFDSDTAAKLNAQLPQDKTFQLGKGGATFSIEWKNKTTLAVSSTGDVYIAGETARIVAEHFGIAEEPKIKIVPNETPVAAAARVSLDKP